MVLGADRMPIDMAVGGGDGDGHIVLGYRLRRVNRLWEREVRGRWRLARKRQRLLLCMYVHRQFIGREKI
jgi:hypothetical protein